MSNNGCCPPRPLDVRFSRATQGPPGAQGVPGDDTPLSNVWFVDPDKIVTLERDGSMAKPFETMAEAIAAWHTESNGTIYVVKCESDWAWPDRNSNGTLRIVGMRDHTSDGSGRTYIGAPDADVVMAGYQLFLTLENVDLGDTTFVSSTGSAFVLVNGYSSRLYGLTIVGGNISGGVELHDCYFYQSTINVNSNVLMSGCLMGDIEFSVVGCEAYITGSINRPTGSFSAQPFAIDWPSSHASNKAFIDSLTAYLNPTATNGTKVTMA